MIKPSIIEIISQRVELRRAGRQWRGLCPFHGEKTPSFYVDEERGFYCFGCQAKGDVITFIQKAEGASFREALARLGIQNDYRPKPVNTRNRCAAAKLANWMNEQHLKIAALLRELSQKIGIAEQIPDMELVEPLNRAWKILSDLYEDLQRPEHVAELLEAKDSIEAITALAPVEPLPDFPEWTHEYEEYLAAHLPEMEPAC
jgi:hypothetical protein